MVTVYIFEKYTGFSLANRTFENRINKFYGLMSGAVKNRRTSKSLQIHTVVPWNILENCVSAIVEKNFQALIKVVCFLTFLDTSVEKLQQKWNSHRYINVTHR